MSHSLFIILHIDKTKQLLKEQITTNMAKKPVFNEVYITNLFSCHYKCTQRLRQHQEAILHINTADGQTILGFWQVHMDIQLRTAAPQVAFVIPATDS